MDISAKTNPGAPRLYHKRAKVEGLSLFDREAGSSGRAQLVLLHGFPASSHQYRHLIPALADRFQVLAPDYPGFGNSEMPDPSTFPYTFDKLSEVVEGFLTQQGFDRAAALRGSVANFR